MKGKRKRDSVESTGCSLSFLPVDNACDRRNYSRKDKQDGSDQTDDLCGGHPIPLGDGEGVKFSVSMGKILL